MNKVKTTVGAGIFIMAALLTAGVISTGHFGKAFAQNQSMMNQTANQTAATNQTAAQMANKTSTNQTSGSKLKLTASDVQDIRKSLEDIRKSIADGKATDALKTINEIDNKLLVAMSENPPPMLEKSAGNSNSNSNSNK